MAVKSKAKPKAAAKKSAAAMPKKTAAAKAPKYVYTWGAAKADGNGGMKNLLGGKGANLAEMTRIGLPVPPGFTITTEVCTYFYANKRTYPTSLQAQMEAGVPQHGKDHGYKFGDATGFPAARRRALRRPRFDAGHDGHDPEPRPERPDRPLARQRPPRTSASPGIATAASSRCMATSCSACRNAKARTTSRSRR